MPTTSDSQTYYWADPVASTTYQLYAGGKTYNVRDAVRKNQSQGEAAAGVSTRATDPRYGPP
jgi:hypothetical protein